MLLISISLDVRYCCRAVSINRFLGNITLSVVMLLFKSYMSVYISVPMLFGSQCFLICGIV